MKSHKNKNPEGILSHLQAHFNAVKTPQKTPIPPAVQRDRGVTSVRSGSPCFFNLCFLRDARLFGFTGCAVLLGLWFSCPVHASNSLWRFAFPISYGRFGGTFLKFLGSCRSALESSFESFGFLAHRTHLPFPGYNIQYLSDFVNSFYEIFLKNFWLQKRLTHFWGNRPSHVVFYLPQAVMQGERGLCLLSSQKNRTLGAAGSIWAVLSWVLIRLKPIKRPSLP